MARKHSPTFWRRPLTAISEHAGKNAALNAGLAFVEGDLVVLTDDDAFPKPDWLERLRFDRGVASLQRIYCDNGSEFVVAARDPWVCTNKVILDRCRG